MARKPKQVAEFEYSNTQESFPILLDTSSGIFRIILSEHYGKKLFESSTLPEVQRLARVYLDQLNEAKWKPVIMVQYDDLFKEEHHINLKYERLFMAIRGDGQKVFRKYIPDGTMGQSTYPREGKNLRFIAYTKPAWDGLLTITKMVEALNMRIKDFIANADLADKLSEISVKNAAFLLEAPEKVET